MPNSSSIPPANLEAMLLLASPSLHDDLFRKSVVFIAEHNKKHGAYGLILNQPTDQTVGDLFKKNEFKPLNHLNVFIGGPVAQEKITFAVFQPKKNKTLRFSTRISAEEAIAQSQHPGSLVRAFAGHSSWEPDQLEKELKQNSWIVSPVSQVLLTHTHDKNLWADVLRSLSPFHKILAECPDDVFSN